MLTIEQQLAREIHEVQHMGIPATVSIERVLERARQAAEAIRIASADEHVPSRVRHAGMALDAALSGEG